MNQEHSPSCQSHLVYMVGGIGDLSNPPTNRAVHYSCDCGLGDNSMKTDSEAESLRARIAELEALAEMFRESIHQKERAELEALQELDEARAELAAVKADAERYWMALHEIAEQWAGAECGEPVYAQEAYAILLCKRMFKLAAAAMVKPKSAR